MRPLVYVGLGSNLSEPATQISRAIDAISTIANSSIESVSSLYVSRPMGPQDQPDYFNAVLALRTELSPLALLYALQAIENNAGRVRKENRWGARVLDLDILLFGEEIIANERLTIPHYGLKLREFVVLPLFEIAPQLRLPDGDYLAVLAKTISTNGLTVHSQLR